MKKKSFKRMLSIIMAVLMFTATFASSVFAREDRPSLDYLVNEGYDLVSSNANVFYSDHVFNKKRSEIVEVGVYAYDNIKVEVMGYNGNNVIKSYYLSKGQSRLEQFPVYGQYFYLRFTGGGTVQYLVTLID